ncbi:MAG: bifunctional demethylmenaquinone methyltransferase/2-methoxy-6-polyprenyl-1,4-benzoquinol methylase UbiE [Phaeodactylibacter sp.]|nr:bifunctional demethylmenaquinone methyltransferase/2-methoxy-6-polyprenyl-1,4-benzoquinol methylase UbiE [Phaeodactylibacter sp.]MCB9303498.1 bifunctional demethylmenaquinone methyltransferase/2-methoxy-6-polyprenyl-1,4-benzoquinol methylase UbiE [Lewinellaceae bacterium]HQU60934.1 bifunctional demethylmenaquinone methyltransferase/2-methoxy-6-polyprenyl-1,4-benzoquinol methylase UbiE [Saprospiraceae bacterium]
MPQEVKPYSQEDSKKTQVGRMFDGIAPYYDFLNRFLSLGIDTLWRKRAIRQLAGHQTEVLLDVATGTADLALEAARQLQPNRIVGLDLSNEMLEIGRSKVLRRHLDGLIELTQGDSENLPFEDNTFDAVTVAFGVRNFENLDKGLKEMRRVLKPGGKAVILEFSKPRLFPFKQLYNSYFRYILPTIGKLTSKDPKAYRYLYESVQAFPDGQDFINILEKTGYKSNRCIPLTLGICSIYTGEK